MLFLVLCTVLALGITAEAAPIHARVNLSESSNIQTYNGGSNTAVNISGGVVFGQLIEAEGTIKNISVRTASYANNIGGIELKLYKWNGSYSSSVSGKVLAKEEFIDFADGAILLLDLTGKNISGNVLLTATGTKENVAIWCYNKGMTAFVDGTELPELSGGITFSEIRNAEKIKVPDTCVDAYAGVDIKNPADVFNSHHSLVNYNLL